MALSLLDLTFITVRDLTGNLVRSGLTTLGIFMGVAAVNATLNIDAITSAQIQQKLDALDNPFLIPYVYDPTWSTDPPDITDEEFNLMQQEIAGIQSISQRVSVWSISTIRYQEWVVDQASIFGVSANFLETSGRRLMAGRFFDQADYDQYHPVAIIDQEMAAQLFQGESPLGKGIYGDNMRLTVVGLMETKRIWAEEEPTGEMWITQNLADALAGNYSYGQTQIGLRRLEDFEAVQTQVEKYLAQNYPNFSVRIWSNADEIYREQQQQRTSARIFKVIGLLALVIGGVGIANITVATVVERTREIGLRRAIGATDWEVMLQFIMEAALLSLVGGLTAVGVVHGLTKVATTTLFEAPYTFQMQDALLSMGAAFGVGVGASFLPALRVTQIDVVQALRGE